jgi:hypothetical protein
MIEEKDLNNSISEKESLEKKQLKNFNTDEEESVKSQDKNFKKSFKRKRGESRENQERPRAVSITPIACPSIKIGNRKRQEKHLFKFPLKPAPI